MSKVSKTYNQHFRAEWLRDARFENWLLPVEGDSIKCICKFCKSILWAKLSDIDRHRKTRKHQNRSGIYCFEDPDGLIKGGIDTEKLISLVKENVEVYDGKQHNKEIISEIWKRIAEELGTTGSEARKKWCIIRSNYIQEKRKLFSSSSNSVEEPISPWPFFESLKFLDNYLRHYTAKEVTPNAKQLLLNQITKKEILKDCLDGMFNSSETINTDNLGTVSLTHEETAEKPTKNKGTTTKILRLLNEIVSKTTDENDSDILFLRSLLPSIKKLGIVENLEFKEEVIQLLKRKLQQQSNTICFTPNSSSVAICYGDQRQTVPTSSQNHVENSAETIIIYPQHP